MKEFTEEDWDDIMLKCPELKAEYEKWLSFIILNPHLEDDINKKTLEINGQYNNSISS